jgi:hypothetical protein
MICRTTLSWICCVFRQQHDSRERCSRTLDFKWETENAYKSIHALVNVDAIAIVCNNLKQKRHSLSKSEAAMCFIRSHQVKSVERRTCTALSCQR